MRLNDHDDKLPALLGWNGYVGECPWWPCDLFPYVDYNVGLWICPATKDGNMLASIPFLNRAARDRAPCQSGPQENPDLSCVSPRHPADRPSLYNTTIGITNCCHVHITEERSVHQIRLPSKYVYSGDGQGYISDADAGFDDGSLGLAWMKYDDMADPPYSPHASGLAQSAGGMLKAKGVIWPDGGNSWYPGHHDGHINFLFLDGRVERTHEDTAREWGEEYWNCR